MARYICTYNNIYSLCFCVFKVTIFIDNVSLYVQHLYVILLQVLIQKC